jgi:hypothetical protein
LPDIRHEALLLHAAIDHGGLPKLLDQVTSVPIPHGPILGRPFEYRREGDTAVLLAPAGGLLLTA